MLAEAGGFGQGHSFWMGKIQREAQRVLSAGRGCVGQVLGGEPSSLPPPPPPLCFPSASKTAPCRARLQAPVPAAPCLWVWGVRGQGQAASPAAHPSPGGTARSGRVPPCCQDQGWGEGSVHGVEKEPQAR